MKIIGSSIIITILLLMSQELKVTPYVSKIELEEHAVNETEIDRVVVYIKHDYLSNDKITKKLIYGSRWRNIFSGSFEHPLLLGEPPDYIFSKLRFSAYAGPNPASFPTNLSITAEGRYNLQELRKVLQYFDKFKVKKEIFLIEITKIMLNGDQVEENRFLVEETFRFFPKPRTTIIKIDYSRGKINRPTMSLSMWGCGVVNVVGYRNWEIEDIAPLLAGLLGVPIPTNSIGKTPEELLNLSKPLMARLRAGNSFHLASACVSTAPKYCSFRPFGYINQPFMSLCDLRKYLDDIQSNLRNENYELVRMMAKHLEDRSLKCILQNKKLCITFTVILASTLTFLWIYIVILSFIVLGEITEYNNRTVMIFTVLLHLIFYLLIVACAHAVFALNWPYRYIVYLAIIVILLWIALFRSSYVFNFVPVRVKSFIAWLLMFYFAVIEIVFWSWEKDIMLFALLVPYVTAEWVYKHHYSVGKNLGVAILLNVSLLLLCYLNYIQPNSTSFDKQYLELFSAICWVLVGFPVAYKYNDNPFVLAPVLITQLLLVYLLIIVRLEPIAESIYIKASSWWPLTAPIVVFCLTDRNSISVFLVGYSSSIPVTLLSTGFESLALLILFVHIYSWYTMESVPEADSLRKVARGVSLYLYMFLCHMFTRSDIDVNRFFINSSENWLLALMLKVYKELVPSLLCCFLWAVLHNTQKQSFSKTVNYVLLLCVSVSFRHFTSVVIDDKMENLLNNYLFHLNCLLSLLITKVLFKEYKVPFGFFVPYQQNKKLFVVTKFLRNKIQEKDEIYNCLFILCNICNDNYTSRV